MNHIIEKIRAQIHQVLDPLIPLKSTCVLVDFPEHGNVGDSAIWLGEIAYLEQRKCQIRYICDHKTYSRQALNEAIGSGTILIHGGG